MEIYLLLLLSFHFFIWGLSWFPQIKVYIPTKFRKNFPFLGMNLFCFCILNMSKDEFDNNQFLKMIAKHEYRHQCQQRIFSPLLFALLYFGELAMRIIFLKQTKAKAYNCLSWEKDANSYMEELERK